MTRTFQLALATIFLCFAPLSAQQQDASDATKTAEAAAELFTNELKLASGTKLFFLLSRETDQTVMGARIAISMHFHLSAEAGKSTAKGLTPLTFTTQRVTGLLDVPTAGLKDIRFDTAEKKKPKPSIALPQLRKAVDDAYAAVGKSFRVDLDKTGAPVEVTNLDEAEKKAAIPAGGLDSWEMLVPSLPKPGVAVGKGWQFTRERMTAIFATRIEENYRLKSADKKSLKLTMSGTPKLDEKTPQEHPYAKMFTLGPASVASVIELSREDGFLISHVRSATTPLSSKTGGGAGEAIKFFDRQSLKRLSALPKPTDKKAEEPTDKGTEEPTEDSAEKKAEKK